MYTRKLVGSGISLIKDGSTAKRVVESTVNESLEDNLFIGKNLIVHYDQGSAYVAKEHLDYLESQGIKVSMSDPGKPTQNPYSEGYISLLSRFCLSHYVFDSFADLDRIVNEFFKNYNEYWVHNNIDKLSPNDRLKRYRKHTLESQILCPVFRS